MFCCSADAGRKEFIISISTLEKLAAIARSFTSSAPFWLLVQMRPPPLLVMSLVLLESGVQLVNEMVNQIVKKPDQFLIFKLS